MPKPCRAAAALACALLAVQPAAAAEDRRDLTAQPHRGAAFAGASLRVPLGGAGRQAPTARLQLSPRYLAGDGVRAGSGVELHLRGNGKAALSIGGRSTARMEKKLALRGSSSTYILIGGVVLLSVLLLASLASAIPQPGPQEGAFD